VTKGLSQIATKCLYPCVNQKEITLNAVQWRLVEQLPFLDARITNPRSANFGHLFLKSVTFPLCAMHFNALYQMKISFYNQFCDSFDTLFL
jgi:hypothetical protein